MIRRMRLKFFFATSGIVVLMISAFCGSILISTHARNIAQARGALDKLMNTFETLSDRPPPEDGDVRWQINSRRAFLIHLDHDNQSISPVHVSSYFEPEEIYAYALQILENGKLKGFMVRVQATSEGKIIGAIDMSIDNTAFSRLSLTVFLIGGGGLVILLVLVWLLSFRIVRPAEAALEKQRRFISEASHELRTPLTIISTGAELIEKKKHDEVTKKWIADIKQQAERMTVMAADLLALSNLDETRTATRTEFDISQTVLEEVLSFETVAFEQGKQIISDIEEGIVYRGNQKAVSQALGILCDNAIKHSDEKAIIKIALKKQNSKMCLTVSNTGELDETEIPYIFERFYRGKESRAKTPGTGLGLSILKALADKNGWKTNVKINSDRIIFTLIF